MVLLRLLWSLCVMKNLVHDGWTEEKSDDIVYFTPDAYKVGDEAFYILDY